jgi:hypothetical protein
MVLLALTCLVLAETDEQQATNIVTTPVHTVENVTSSTPVIPAASSVVPVTAVVSSASGVVMSMLALSLTILFMAL